MKPRNLIFITGLLILAGCQDNKQLKALETKYYRLSYSHDSLKEQHALILRSLKHMEEREEQAKKEAENLRKYPDGRSLQEILGDVNASPGNTGTTYAFAVIVTLQKSNNWDPRMGDMPSYSQYENVSQIKTFSSWSEETKYRMLDEFTASVRKQPGYDETVSRKCYHYPTYKEASLAREKFTVRNSSE